MKRFFTPCLMVAVLLLPSTMTAQNRIGILTANSTPEEINKYFSDNIMLLDPIEGVWSVEMTQKSWNNYRTFPDMTRNYYEGIAKSGNSFYNVGEETTIILDRIGETNVYNCKISISGPAGNFWMSKRVALTNGVAFSFTLDVSGHDGSGNRETLSFSFIKEYPTASMYEDAIKRKLEEQPSEWTGSGFALNNGYLCTNNHVAEGAKSIKIFGVQGDFTTSYSAKVVASDKVNDLAILKIDDVRFPGFGAIPYEVKTTMDEVGVGVFVLGYPLTTTMGNEVKLTTGVISSKTGFQGDVSLYQISAPIQPGNSGGPLFDSKGNLIGIVNAKHRSAENVSYAIKASYLQNLMMSTLSEDILPKNNAISSLSLSDKVAKVKNFVFYIECSSGGVAASNSQSVNTPPANSSGTNGSHNSSVTSGTGTSSGSNVKVDIRNPYVKNSPKGLTIKRVRMTDTQTIIDLEYYNYIGRSRWVTIDPKTYIKTQTGSTYTLTKADGIPIKPKKHWFSSYYDKLQFTLIFPALPDGTTEFDLIESRRSTWKFYGIRFK